MFLCIMVYQFQFFFFFNFLLNYKSGSIKFFIFLTDRSAGRIVKCLPNIVNSKLFKKILKMESIFGMAARKEKPKVLQLVNAARQELRVENGKSFMEFIMVRAVDGL